MKMILEMGYAMGIMLSVIVVEHWMLRRLEGAGEEQIKRALKFQSSPLFIAGAFVWAFAAVLLVPKLFGFKLNFPGFYIGMALYMGYAFRVAKPKWKGHKERIAASRMQALGKSGERMADLTVRKVSDYVPVWALTLPYLILLALPVYLLIQVGASGFRAPSILIIGMIYMLAIGMTVFLTKGMFALVQKPMDLRSEAPDQFAARIQTFLRGRLRIMLVFQVAYALSTASLMLVSTSAPGMDNAHGMLSSNWILFGSLPFLLCGVWIAVYSARGMAKLEEERWASAPEVNP